MGWVDSPKFFCAFLETLIDVANTLVDTDLKVPSYGAIFKIPETGPGPPHTSEILTHIYFYIYDVISAVQGGPEFQHRVFDGTVRALKWLFPSFPVELKDSVSVKKIITGEGGWTRVGPAENFFNLHMLPVNRNYLQNNLTCYLLAE